jgi:hypothetical protein
MRNDVEDAATPGYLQSIPGSVSASNLQQKDALRRKFARFQP